MSETTATHFLQRQGWAWSVGLRDTRDGSDSLSVDTRAPCLASLEGNHRQQRPTICRVEEELCQQAWNGVRDRSDLPTAEPRVGFINHLENQRQQRLTNCKPEDELGQSALTGAWHSSNSPPSEPRVGLVSEFRRVPGTLEAHVLQSRGQV